MLVRILFSLYNYNMKIYISGISGTGMGPLALMAKMAGIEVCGSDLAAGAIYGELVKNGIDIHIGAQDGTFLKEKIREGIDWFVYTSALSDEHPELKIAKAFGIKCTKRDELTAFLIGKLKLKMVAVAGTHGKTTTTSMIIFAATRLGLPVAYVVGTTLGFAVSGSYNLGDEFFVYEADEYDRNFLKFHPWLAVLTAVSYDHPDIYHTVEEYKAAFRQFESQSEVVVEKPEISSYNFNLAGEVRRYDAALAFTAIRKMAPNIATSKIIEILNDFPGVGRRFEKICDGVYTDYAHHPEEIAATMQVAQDEAKLKNKKGVIVVYQPHQNTRQYEVREKYKDAFEGAEKIFWLPTYLTRENPELPILRPEELISEISHKEIVEVADLNDGLHEKLTRLQKNGYLILLMTAGPADEWLRKKFAIL